MHNRPSPGGHCVLCHEVALEKPKGWGRQLKVISKWELLLTKFAAAWALEQKNSKEPTVYPPRKTQQSRIHHPENRNTDN